MPTLRDDVIAILSAFALLFSDSVFAHVQILIAGIILTPHRRTVASALRAMELAHQKRERRHKKTTDWARQMLLQVRR